MSSIKNRMASILVIILALLACMVVLCGCDSEEVKSAKEDLNAEIERIEGQVSALQEEITAAEDLATTEETPLDESVIPAVEDEISNAKTVEFTAPAIPSDLEDINLETAKLKEVDYETNLQSLKEAEQAVNDSIEKMKLVTNPSEAYVLEHLRGIDGVDEIAAATEDNDPNGQLHKDGGYTSAVFFTSSWVDQSEVYGGSSVIDKGTSGGGCIEVFATTEDANERDTYLAAFDGSVLSSGSHTVIGTVVIRTSDELTASQQDKLETAIIESLTKLD